MPKISIALCGRNDNYQNNWLEVAKFSICSLQRALENIDYEIVLLDYNPPKDKPLLSECFPKKDYPKIKHVVFSHEDHLEFVECHLKFGSKILIKNQEMPEDKIKSLDFIGTVGGNLSIKNCTGDYILSTGSGNIFPKQFGEFIDKLKPNILYRTWIYRTRNNIKKILNISLAEIDKLNKYEFVKNKFIVKYNVSNCGMEFQKKRTGNIWSASGNFLLMDGNSWKEVGGYLPTIDIRLPCGDSQAIYHALSCGKKIRCANSPIFNIHYKNKKYTKRERDSNYIIIDNNNKEKYNHKIEMKKWGKFEKWSINSILNPNQEYFMDTNYKKRFLEIKNIFQSFLPEKFLIK